MVEVFLSWFSERWAQKRHYTRKIQITKMKMWDVEFLRAKMKAMREGIRIEYDRIKEITDAANIRLAAEKGNQDPDKTICSNLEALVKKHEPDLKQLEEQMKGIDGQVEAQNGLNEAIDGYRTVIGLLREHRKQV